jgi:hypothetical protein
MLEPENIVVEGLSFQLSPLPALKAMRLDKRILTAIAPVLGGLKDLNLEAELDMAGMSEGITTALDRLEDNVLEKLLVDLFSTVIWSPEGGVPESLDSSATINKAFQGNLMGLYKLAFAVMRYNKFTPFALASIGGGMSKILGFAKETQKPKPLAKGLAK